MPLPQDRMFLFRGWRDTPEHFRKFCDIAARLKPHGRVLVNLYDLASKSTHDIPPGNSPWHAYTNLYGGLARFFPHPKIAPHVPAD